MTTGEVRVKEPETVIVPLHNKIEMQTEIIIEKTEFEISTTEKIASSLKVKERFSRLKKSLRRRSVSIL